MLFNLLRGRIPLLSNKEINHSYGNVYWSLLKKKILKGKKEENSWLSLCCIEDKADAGCDSENNTSYK